MITALAQAAPIFSSWTGSYDADTLSKWIALEFGAPDALENPQAYGKGIRTRVITPKTIVHILSGNTPHAAWQSLLRGLLLGAHNLLKLPTNGLLDFEGKIAELPSALREKITCARALPADWLNIADALVVFGNDATIRHFRNLAPLHIPFIGHGHRLGIGLITEPNEEAATLAARDIATFNQQGCLSLHALFLPAEKIESFGNLLARALADFEKKDPRSSLDPSADGAIATLREETRFLAANLPEQHRLWESPESTAWTIIAKPTQEITPSPLNRTIFLQPLKKGEAASKNSAFRIPNSVFLSGIALHPFQPEKYPYLPSPRIFPLGQAQTPPLIWHHDGLPPLASLVKFQDIG